MKLTIHKTSSDKDHRIDLFLSKFEKKFGDRVTLGHYDDRSTGKVTGTILRLTLNSDHKPEFLQTSGPAASYTSNICLEFEPHNGIDNDQLSDDICAFMKDDFGLNDSDYQLDMEQQPRLRRC